MRIWFFIFLFIIGVISYPALAISHADWEFVPTPEGFSVELPQGWIMVPFENTFHAVGFAEYGKNDVLLTIGYVVNQEGIISKEQELRVLADRYANLVGVTLTSEPIYQDNSIMAFGEKKNGDLSQFQIISKKDHLLLINAIYTSKGAGLHYAEIIGGIVDSIVFD